MRWNFIDDYDERYCMGFDLSQLVLDQFYLNINYNSSVFPNLYLYTLNRQCIECPYLLTHYGNKNSNSCAKANQNIFATNLKFRIATENAEYSPQDRTSNVICDLDHDFGQFGVYTVEVNSTGCFVEEMKQPVNIYSPILTVALVYIALYVVLYGVYLKWIKRNPAETPAENNKPKKERIMSLDTFRGISIVIMIYANFGSGGYEFMDHSKWNGLHVADLVFPWFMWIMGACIPISLASSFKKQISNKTLVVNALKRSIKLFCLGVFLTGGSDLNYLRLFGVLQRFGITYFVVTVICIYCTKKTSEPDENSKLGHFQDILKISKGWLIVTIIMIVHTITIFTVAAPGCPTGYMGPGGLHKNRSYSECIGGATGYIDGLILGNFRYQNPTIYKVFEAKPFDPEGVVGCLTSIFHVFIGLQAGTTLLVYKKHSQRLLRWLTWAVVTGLIGGGLCGFSKEDGLIPVNKNLWSLSFVMVTSCFAFLLLSFCYVLVDVRKLWSGKPFLFAGMNAILMYLGHEMTDGHFPVRWYIHNYSDLNEDPRRTHFLAMFSDLWGMGVWVLIAYYLYKINYFFTV